MEWNGINAVFECGQEKQMEGAQTEERWNSRRYVIDGGIEFGRRSILPFSVNDITRFVSSAIVHRIASHRQPPQKPKRNVARKIVDIKFSLVIPSPPTNATSYRIRIWDLSSTIVSFDVINVYTSSSICD